MLRSRGLVMFVYQQNRELQIMRRLDHINIIQLKYFFFSSEEKVSDLMSMFVIAKGMKVVIVLSCVTWRGG